jgi:hypothetical protein
VPCWSGRPGERLAAMIPLHLGPLHPAEQALTYGLAFGPFVLLAVVIVVRRRQDARDDDPDERDPAQR